MALNSISVEDFRVFPAVGVALGLVLPVTGGLL